MAECAKQSSLFKDKRIEIIPNGIDTECFKPRDKQFARDLFSLPQDKYLILFGAVNSTSDERKGFQYLQSALQRLGASGWADKAELVIFGASEPTHAPDLGLKANYLGNFHDDEAISLLYAACDIFVAPSTQDNLPNTVMEALACGLPSIAFSIGGMRDLIEHEQTGMLVQPFNDEDLAKGIAWILSDDNRRMFLSQRARKKAEQEFMLDIQAKRYIDLYQDIIKQR